MWFRREKQESNQLYLGLALLILCCGLLVMNVRRLRADLAAGDAAGMRIEAVFFALGIACIAYFIWVIAAAYRTYVRALKQAKERPINNFRIYFLVRQDFSAIR